MKTKQTMRIVAGLACLFGAVVIIAPHLTNYVSRAAVVNAPILSVKSPFDGSLLSDALTPATPVLPSTAIVKLRASRTSRTELARLEARMNTLTREEETLARQIATLSALDAQLLDRVEEMKKHAELMLRAQLGGLNGERAAAQERQSRLERDGERLERLAANGSAPHTQATRATSLAAEAQGEVIRLTAAVQETRREIASIANGILPGLGTEDGSYAQQRRDEIAIRLADLHSRKDRMSAQHAGLAEEAEALREEVDRLDLFAPVLPTGTVVWSATPAKGSVVAAGDEVLQLLDCSRRFVEVFMHESAFEAISPGDTARVRLHGSNESFDATVEALRGAGSQRAIGQLAAEPESVSEGSLSVLLRLAPADVAKKGVAESFCDVGRTAEVHFDRGLGNAMTFTQLWLKELFRDLWPSVATHSPQKANFSAHAD